MTDSSRCCQDGVSWVRLTCFLSHFGRKWRNLFIRQIDSFHTFRVNLTAKSASQRLAKWVSLTQFFPQFIYSNTPHFSEPPPSPDPDKCLFINISVLPYCSLLCNNIFQLNSIWLLYSRRNSIRRPSDYCTLVGIAFGGHLIIVLS